MGSCLRLSPSFHLHGDVRCEGADEDRLRDLGGAELKSIVDASDFPASRKSAYLNTASVCLMYRGAEASTTDWFRDLTENGTLTFDEAAEE